MKILLLFALSLALLCSWAIVWGTYQYGLQTALKDILFAFVMSWFCVFMLWYGVVTTEKLK